MSSASREVNRLWKDMKESFHYVYDANSDHFNVLTFVFLLPISTSLILYPCIHIALFHPDLVISTRSQPRFFISNLEIIVLLVYALLLALLFLCAVATITYSTVIQAYHVRSINFVSSIKSIRKSFFPILSTFIVSHTIFISITLAIALVLLLLSQILQTFGLIEFKFDLKHLLFLVIFAFIVVLPVLLWLQLHWSLAYVIAVVESKWGFETLRRSSAYLVKEKKSLAFWIHLNFGLIVGGVVIVINIFVISSMLYVLIMTCWWIIPMVMCTMMWWLLVSQVMGQLLIEKVLLYMYCKDSNGEKLPVEIRGKFDDKFVYLPLDDEKNQAIE